MLTRPNRTLIPVTVWRSLLLIYAAIDVRLRRRSQRSQRFAYVLSDQEVQDAVRSFQRFPVLVEELTSGRAGIHYEIKYVQRCLTSLTWMRKGIYWPSPNDTREEIDRFASPGSYDSIFILWPQQNLMDGTSIRSDAWGLGMAASSWSKEATYATVTNTESSRWQIPVVGEVWLHEWLHGVCGYFHGRGYRMPAGDADGGARHGYIQSAVSGWTDYYRDLMTGSVVEEGKPTGIPLDAWRHKPEHRLTA
jgi:hypothetical protein